MEGSCTGAIVARQEGLSGRSLFGRERVASHGGGLRTCHFGAVGGARRAHPSRGGLGGVDLGCAPRRRAVPPALACRRTGGSEAGLMGGRQLDHLSLRVDVPPRANEGRRGRFWHRCPLLCALSSTATALWRSPIHGSCRHDTHPGQLTHPAPLRATPPVGLRVAESSQRGSGCGGGKDACACCRACAGLVAAALAPPAKRPSCAA